ncbi:MAG: indolepyruvate oxidoreductase subunit beta [Ignavibacteriae bacterium]|nr:indolepyruvate oxidoreductase subunit beta [Ignavibacteriota bacterium]
MKRDIILAGVGGQGILTIATVIGYAAVQKGLYLKQSEVHGMSQRGGDVSSHLRIGDTEVHSDLIPEGRCDLIISVEPMESLRYVSFLKPDGWVIANRKPFVNVPNYPEYEKVWERIEHLPHSVLIDGEKIAREVATAKAVNIVLLGAASTHVGLPVEDLMDAIRTIFERKGQAVVDANLRAFEAGATFADQWEHAHVA